jgi:transcriptional regulator with XRE-family HTH domain
MEFLSDLSDERSARTAAAIEVRPTASPAQCRAGRALLGWTQAMLAERSSVARKTIAEFEIGARELRFRTRRDITAALEAGGLTFLWENDEPLGAGAGVRRSHRHD